MPVSKDRSSTAEKAAADIMLFGATGLIGGAFLKLVRDDPSAGKVIAFTRREIPDIRDAPHIHQEVIDFENLKKYRHLFNARTAVCALGTTIKKAGSKEKFRKVDYQLPLNIAAFAAENGCDIFILISAISADPNSSVFYNQVKGELESDIQKLSFKSIHIIRPSILLGDRKEFRFGEEAAKLLIRPASFLIPDKYKPVAADTIARKIRTLIKNDAPGTHFYEGKQIHEPF